jgi:hypothetical protein
LELIDLVPLWRGLYCTFDHVRYCSKLLKNFHNYFWPHFLRLLQTKAGQHDTIGRIDNQQATPVVFSGALHGKSNRIFIEHANASTARGRSMTAASLVNSGLV